MNSSRYYVSKYKTKEDAQVLWEVYGETPCYYLVRRAVGTGGIYFGSNHLSYDLMSKKWRKDGGNARKYRPATEEEVLLFHITGERSNARK
jgi:hypothetical protein